MSLFFSFSTAYGRAEIKGKLQNCYNCKVALILDQSDFSVDKEFFPSKPDRFGNFVFDLGEILRPNVAILEVNGDRFPIYTEPNQQVWLSISKIDENIHVVEFTEGLISENVHLQNWANSNGWVGDRFPNNMWFEKNRVGLRQSVYRNFLATPEYERVDYALDFYNRMIDQVNSGLPSHLSQSYKDFLKTYVSHAAPAMIFNLLAEHTPTDEERLKIATLTFKSTFEENERSNIAFMPHLNSYIDFESKLARKSGSDFNQFFYFVWENAEQIPKKLKEEYLLYTLENELTAETVQRLKPTVEAFAKSLTDLDQMAELLADYEDARDKANGRKAPNFVLQNTDGKMVSLESLKGNKVYLAFWSSSCKPCIEGMKKSVTNKNLLKNNNIIFLYVSTDLTQQTWLTNNMVLNAQPNDLHLWIGKSQPELHEYNAITLPTYYFIDEQGNFLTRFPKSWDVEFVDFVVNQ